MPPRAPRAAKLPIMLESDLQKGLIDLGRMYGWLTAHFRPAWSSKGMRTPVQGDGKGFPDTVMLRAPRRLMVELKRTYADVITKEQAKWLDEAELCGFECYVLYVKDIEEFPILLARKEPIPTHWRKTYGLKIESVQ